MSVCLPEFWKYDTDVNDTEFIVPDPELYDDRGCKLYTADAFQILSTREKCLTIRSYIQKEYDVNKKQSKIYIMIYLYYILYTTQFNLHNKSFYKTVISKLYEFVKVNHITYQKRNIFKEILHMFTGKYICEFKQCTRTCCDKQNKYCNIHLRRINKKSNALTDLTKLPLDISKLVYDYII